MSDDIARLALARSLAARIPSLGHDALLIVDQLVIRLQILQQEHGELDVTTLPRFILYFGTEPVDSALYEIALKLSDQRIDRAAMHEQSRVEMIGPGEAVPPGSTRCARCDHVLDRHRTPGTECVQDDCLCGCFRRPDPAAEFAPDQLTRVGGPEPYEVEVEELDEDPGPHTHVYRGTDQGDECEVGGRMRDQFADLAGERDRGP
jgi:hypothetical protein